ncbi:MAG: riboflavin biosynthesis protein RibD [Omnitrophica WOR_2 bacterium RIFCSPHIGHO2_01_FULL_48_9]|nr:MAG: riboflavin biosynthesis protein RibD [Omnitrophica WOR_2 bacterium RIFCSPHIGHO2_02_FULL_48_11]OGX30825.1 MAG: riboflavin biosynthesis protein RibD [Omnitrophica WOR_2 bacterium RIFCSPHIGHO2_01_FULL_48_9]
MHDIQYIKRAMQLALKVQGETSPNPLVGALLVKNGRIIAQGYHKRCGSDHAEIVALKKAGDRARGATLYVTLEPCFHFGRTPPCVEAILESGIKKVVIGMRDPNPLTNGKSIAKLRRARVQVKVGLLEEELTKMNEAFVKYVTKRMPFVVAKCAQTLDGKIATATGQSKWITSEATRKFARQLRNDFDAILVGIRTVLKDNPRLTAAARTKRIKKIILDSSLQIPKRARLFQGTDPADCFIATTGQAELSKINFFRKKGINVIVCPQRQGHIQLKWLFKELAKKGVTSILLEGGAHTLGCALKEKLVDKMHIYVAPKIFGDQKALSAVTGLRITDLARAIQLRNLEIRKIYEDIFIQGYVYRHR